MTNSGSITNSASCINVPCDNSGSKCILLPLIPVRIYGHDKVEYALLDRGSQRTVCEGSLVNELNLRPESTSSVLEGIWGSNNVNEKVRFEIQSDQNGNKCEIDALVVPKVNARHPPKFVDLSCYPYLSDLPIITDQYPARARILIGLDNAHLLVPYDKRVCDD